MIAEMRYILARYVGRPLEFLTRPSKFAQRRIARSRLVSMRAHPDLVERHRIEKLRTLLQYAGKHVPYYRRLFEESGFDPRSVRSVADLEAIPPLEKSIIQAQREELVAEGIDRRRLRIKRTGGSTGEPTVFYVDTGFSIHEQALTQALFRLYGRRPGGPIAYLWGAPFDVPSGRSLAGRGVRYLRNEEYLARYTLTAADLPLTFEMLERFRPDILLGYTNLIVAFARYIRRHQLKPSFPRASVVCSAETLYPSDAVMLREVFRVPVHNSYGSRDIGLMAFSCDRGRLHMTAEDVILEPYGEPTSDIGDREVLVTKLNCLSMPFIRYRIGDRARFSESSCECGITYPVLDEITGRSHAVVRLADGGVVSAILFPMLLKEFDVTRFQVVQRRDLSLDLFVQEGEVGASAETRIRRILGERCPGLRVRITQEDLKARIGRTGKLEPFISETTNCDVCSD